MRAALFFSLLTFCRPILTAGIADYFTLLDCDASQITLIDNARLEMINMLNNAVSAIGTLTSGNPINPNTQEFRYYRLANMFFAVERDANDLKIKDAAGIARLNTVKAKLQDAADQLNGQGTIAPKRATDFIRCGPGGLLNVDNSEYILENSRVPISDWAGDYKAAFVDVDPDFRKPNGKPAFVFLFKEKNSPICQSQWYAFVAPRISKESPAYRRFLLCDNMFDSNVVRPSFSNLKNNQAGITDRNLANYATFFSGIFIHEFMHYVTYSLDDNGNKTPGHAIDVANKDGRKAYNRDRATVLALEQPEKTTTNADSYRLFVVGAWLNEIQWG